MNERYHIEPHDNEDGSIQWEVWDYKFESCRRIAVFNDEYDFDKDDDGKPIRVSNAKKDAHLVCDALNAYESHSP